MTEEREQAEPLEESENAQTLAGSGDAPVAENSEKETAEEQLSLFKRPKKRNGMYVSKLDEDTLKKLQLRKSIYMYLSTLCFLVSVLIIPTEGRNKLMAAVESGEAYGLPLATLYLGVCIVLFALTVYIVIMNSTWHRITEEIKERYVPNSGLNKHTFISYEIFNALHILLAAGEIALTIYGFDWWGLFNATVAVASAVLCFMSRQILYKANANNLVYVSEEELEKLKVNRELKQKDNDVKRKK